MNETEHASALDGFKGIRLNEVDSGWVHLEQSCVRIERLDALWLGADDLSKVSGPGTELSKALVRIVAWVSFWVSFWAAQCVFLLITHLRELREQSAPRKLREDDEPAS
ncbi:MAG: hypothetical protein ACJA0P_002635 [Planctomycetota bacterium]|jgi:hypothetical protein